MSTARCSSCHCYSRGCPDGLPNHKDSPVGPNCSMNARGRHYRDPTDITNPVCDYESKGQKCDFFSTGSEQSNLPYPPDVSLGPVVSESSGGGNTDMSQILMLLQQQDGKFAQLQEQINALKQHEPSAPPVPAEPQPPVPSAPILPGQPGTGNVSAPPLATCLHGHAGQAHAYVCYNFVNLGRGRNLGRHLCWNN